MARADRRGGGRPGTPHARARRGRRLLAALLLLAARPAAAQPAPPFAAYHESWADIATADPAETRLARLPATLDLVMLAFARPDARYTGGEEMRGTGLGFPFGSSVLRGAVAAFRARAPRARVLLSVGGATYAAWQALDAAAIARLVADLGLDGVDVDFEPAAPGCRREQEAVRCDSDAAYARAVAALRAALPRPALLTVAAWHVGAFGEGAWRDAAPASRYTGGLLRLLRSPLGREIDLLNLMAYDAGPGFQPLQALRAYRAAFAGPVLLGVLVQDPQRLPPGRRLREVGLLARAATAEGAGMMLYSLQMTSPYDRPGAPFAEVLAWTIRLGQQQGQGPAPP